MGYVRLMRAKPDTSVAEIARKLRRAERTIERYITALKTDEIIGRIGPTKGGYWVVFK